MLKKMIDKLMMSLMSIVMLMLVAGAVWQVFTRFILRDPSLFTEEFLRYTLIWSCMLGAAYAFSRDMHLSLVLVKDKVKGPAKTILYIFDELIVLIFAAGVLVYGGFALCARNTTQVSAILRIPMSAVYAVVPISGVIILLVKLGTYVELFQKKKKEKEDETAC